MFWTCQKCGFYNDAPGDCCNCGAASTQSLETLQNVDLLGMGNANNIDQEPVVIDFLNHSQVTKLPTGELEQSYHMHQVGSYPSSDQLHQLGSFGTLSQSSQKSQKQRKKHFDEIDIGGDAYDIDSLIGVELETPKIDKGRHSDASSHNAQTRQLTEAEIAEQQCLGKETRKRAKMEIQGQQDFHSVTFQPNHDTLAAPTLISYTIDRMNCFGLFLHYLSTNKSITFATLILLVSLIATVLLQMSDFETDSFGDHVAHLAPYAMGSLYVIYLICYFPCGLFISRSISLFSTTPHPVPFPSAAQFVEYVQSHAPALTQDQIRVLQHKFSFSDRAAFVYLSIPAQFRTRSEIQGIHHIPTVQDAANDGPNAVLMPSSVRNSSETSSHQTVQMSYKSAYQYPQVITVYKVIQFICFLFLLEPLLGIFLSCSSTNHYRFALKYKP